MEVTIDRASFADAIAHVAGVIVSRSPKPVLTCVKLAADADGTMALSATDLECSIRINTGRIEVKTAGAALIPADKLIQIVRSSADTTLSLKVEKDVATIRGQDARYQVFGFPVADFPPVPEFTSEPHFTLSAGDLRKLVNLTLFAVAKDNSRYAVNGVLFDRKDSHITAVATDGRRLALAKGSCKPLEASEGPPSVIVPAKALAMALRVLTNPEQVVRVRFNDNQILFGTDAAVLSSNLVDGNFPPYKDVIPRDSDKKATLNTAAFASAIRRASLLTNEESKGVRFAFASGGLSISSRAPEMGEAEVSAPVVSYEGSPVEIGFQPGFLLEALKVVEAEQITVDLKAANKPGILRAGGEFLYVVMPVALA